MDDGEVVPPFAREWYPHLVWEYPGPCNTRAVTLGYFYWNESRLYIAGDLVFTLDISIRQNFPKVFLGCRKVFELHTGPSEALPLCGVQTAALIVSWAGHANSLEKRRKQNKPIPAGTPFFWDRGRNIWLCLCALSQTRAKIKLFWVTGIWVQLGIIFLKGGWFWL